jgi:chromate reductase, NAD(P)H dehydrogenase (quinone)
MKVLGISGSLRRDSFNTRLLQVAASIGADDVELELYEGMAAVPPFSQDDEHAPPDAVLDLRARIAAADAVLISTPEYNGSIPGQLKNALDWVSRPRAESPLRGKPTGVVSASTSAYGAMWSQADLRRVLGIIGARVAEPGVAIGTAHDQFDATGGDLTDDTRAELAGVLAALAAEVEAGRLPIAA